MNVQFDLAILWLHCIETMESEWVPTCFRGDLIGSRESPLGRQSRVYTDSLRLRGTQVSSGRADSGHLIALLWRGNHPLSVSATTQGSITMGSRQSKPTVLDCMIKISERSFQKTMELRCILAN